MLILLLGIKNGMGVATMLLAVTVKTELNFMS